MISIRTYIRIVLTFCFCLIVIAGFSQMKLSEDMVNASFPHYHFANYTPMQSDTNTFTINYDSADAEIWGASYSHNRTHLMNMHYTTNADSSAANTNVINYYTVAFDSLVDPYNNESYNSGSTSGINIDTVIIPLIQVNHSGVNDTLEVQINYVNNYGYPTNIVLQKKVIINKVIGDSNTSSYVSFIKIPENYSLPTGTQFAITVMYFGAKQDSCWFIYGCGTYAGTCGGNGPYTLAEPSSYSKVLTTKGSYTANSFLMYNTFRSKGLLPSANGELFYYNCNNDTVYAPGDAVTYFQNVNVYAVVTALPLGMNEISINDFSISQNSPNPFNETSQITYVITKVSDVIFSVFDITGRKLINNLYSDVVPGEHKISLAANQFTSGVYFYTFNVNGISLTKKMVITK
jgi:hypothetical protein